VVRFRFRVTVIVSHRVYVSFYFAGVLRSFRYFRHSASAFRTYCQSTAASPSLVIPAVRE